jgi:hypothetical protein
VRFTRTGDRAAVLIAVVDERVGALPADAGRLWQRVKTGER